MALVCGQCGEKNHAGALFCSRCGAARAQRSELGEHFTVRGQTMRSVGVAYGLWALGIVGVAGIHRFYCRKYLTGAIWLLTAGLCGIGTIVDLFLMNQLVTDANRAERGPL